jgi:hypothetical protein
MTVRRYPSSPFPSSAFRDRMLNGLAKEDPRMRKSVRKSYVQFMPRKKLVRVTIDFDPYEFVKRLR